MKRTRCGAEKEGFTLVELTVGIVLIAIVILPCVMAITYFFRTAFRAGEYALGRDFASNNVETNNIWGYGGEPKFQNGAGRRQGSLFPPFRRPTWIARGQPKTEAYSMVGDTDTVLGSGAAAGTADPISNAPPGNQDVFRKLEYTMKDAAGRVIVRMEGSTLRYLLPGWVIGNAEEWNTPGTNNFKQSQYFDYWGNQGSDSVAGTAHALFRSTHDPDAPRYINTPKIVGVRLWVSSGQTIMLTGIGFSDWPTTGPETIPGDRNFYVNDDFPDTISATIMTKTKGIGAYPVAWPVSPWTGWSHTIRLWFTTSSIASALPAGDISIGCDLLFSDGSVLYNREFIIDRP